MGPAVVQTKKGVSGLHAQPSQWRSFRKSLFVNERGKKEEEVVNDNLGRGVGLQLSSVLLLGSISPKYLNGTVVNERKKTSPGNREFF